MTRTFDSGVSLHYWLLWPMVRRRRAANQASFLLNHAQEMSTSQLKPLLHSILNSLETIGMDEKVLFSSNQI